MPPLPEATPLPGEFAEGQVLRARAHPMAGERAAALRDSAAERLAGHRQLSPLFARKLPPRHVS